MLIIAAFLGYFLVGFLLGAIAFIWLDIEVGTVGEWMTCWPAILVFLIGYATYGMVTETLIQLKARIRKDRQ